MALLNLSPQSDSPLWCCEVSPLTESTPGITPFTEPLSMDDS